MSQRANSYSDTVVSTPVQATTTKELTTTTTTKIRTRPWTASIILIGGLIALPLGMAISICFGAANIELATVWNAIFHFDPNVSQHHVIQDVRLPRILGAAMIGACFAVAGAMMQGMTRNPLADSGLLGLNAGAAFMLAVCFAFLPSLPYMYLILFSFIGAGIAVGIVYGIGSMAKGGLTPVRLVLAGSALTALLSAASEGIALQFGIGQDLAFWYAGGVSGTDWNHLKIMFPWVCAALIGAIMLSRSITILSLGEDVAKGLGHHVRTIRALGMLIVLILAGTAVSVVGAVGFVGLIVPHLTRYLVGVDYRWIIPCSAVIGSLLVVFADLAARMIHPPHETPVGALIALIGVPFFLYLARKERRGM
ncbi:FecCD family ABC transporter permease [Paenibacillus arenosi]|uniref:Iron ABC transporter permease n=1 Tax=Paenibacillus arenosi TaxID=2774142 RepID=A0ABR9AYT9_9BACL|nr:iron ABC transporter permease [Paenibacillus arenosi]MBD8499318.1 iron ABC transporter permease [Paenibacillus arenosi]